MPKHNSQLLVEVRNQNLIPGFFKGQTSFSLALKCAQKNVIANSFGIKSKYSISYLRNHQRGSQVPQRQNHLLSYIKRELIAPKVIETGAFFCIGYQLQFSSTTTTLSLVHRLVVNPVMPDQFA